MKQYIKKADVILFIALVAASLALSAVFALRGNAVINSGSSGANQQAEVVIKSGGSLVSRQPLTDDAVLEVAAPDGRGYNVVTVKDRKVSVTEASCKNKVCVRHGAVSGPGETIVCLPNRLIVSIEGGSGDEGGSYDSISS